MDETYRTYRAELDDILLNGDPKRLRKFMRQHGMQVSAHDQVIEATFHKTITAAVTLPIERRRASKAWLEARGYHALDDGDL